MFTYWFLPGCILHCPTKALAVLIIFDRVHSFTLCFYYSDSQRVLSCSLSPSYQCLITLRNGYILRWIHQYASVALWHSCVMRQPERTTETGNRMLMLLFEPIQTFFLFLDTMKYIFEDCFRGVNIQLKQIKQVGCFLKPMLSLTLKKKLNAKPAICQLRFSLTTAGYWGFEILTVTLTRLHELKRYTAVFNCMNKSSTTMWQLVLFDKEYALLEWEKSHVYFFYCSSSSFVQVSSIFCCFMFILWC